MTPEELRGSLARAGPPAGLGKPLEALWHAARGDWDRAHRIVMSAKSRDAAWVHAYPPSPGRRSRQRALLVPAGEAAGVRRASLEDEWTAIAGEMLGRP